MNFLKIPKYFYYLPISPWFVKIVCSLLFNNERKSIINQEIRNILIVKLDEIGDFVLCTPFLRELRRNHPDARISLIVKEEVFNLAETCPYINVVMVFNTRMNKFFRVYQQYYRMYKIGKKYLWNEKLDLAIIPRWDRDNNYHAFVACLSGAVNIVGYNQNDGTEKLLTMGFEKSNIQHEVLNNLRLINFLGGSVEKKNTELWFDEQDKKYVDKILEPYRCDVKKIVVSPGAALQKRRWPKENYSELIRLIENNNDNNCLFIILGSSDESDIGNYISNSNINAINLMGHTTLRQAAALIKMCDLFIGNDSGLMHIAAAVNTRVIEISCHPVHGVDCLENSPLRFGPWTLKKRVFQPLNSLPPCQDRCLAKKAHCITQIKVEDVLKEVCFLKL